MDYKTNSNTGLIIVADCMLLSVEYIGNVHLFFNSQHRIQVLLRYTGEESLDRYCTVLLSAISSNLAVWLRYPKQ